VRESEAKTKPSSTLIAKQYVILLLLFFTGE
jgi:hypothetical protein